MIHFCANLTSGVYHIKKLILFFVSKEDRSREYYYSRVYNTERVTNIHTRDIYNSLQGNPWTPLYLLVWAVCLLAGPCRLVRNTSCQHGGWRCPCFDATSAVWTAGPLIVGTCQAACILPRVETVHDTWRWSLFQYKPSGSPQPSSLFVHTHCWKVLLYGRWTSLLKRFQSQLLHEGSMGKNTITLRNPSFFARLWHSAR